VQRHAGRACAIATALLLLIEVIDIPFVLYGAALHLERAAAADPAARAGPIIWWMTALNGGGRMALCLAAGVLAAELAGARRERVAAQP
jgi:hypothetical protein